MTSRRNVGGDLALGQHMGILLLIKYSTIEAFRRMNAQGWFGAVWIGENKFIIFDLYCASVQNSANVAISL